MTRRPDLKDLTVLVRKTCPKCEGTGFYGPAGALCSCPNCRGVAGCRVDEEVPLLELICMIEQYKQDNALELSDGLRELFDAKAARLNPGRKRPYNGEL